MGASSSACLASGSPVKAAWKSENVTSFPELPVIDSQNHLLAPEIKLVPHAPLAPAGQGDPQGTWLSGLKWPAMWNGTLNESESYESGPLTGAKLPNALVDPSTKLSRLGSPPIAMGLSKGVMYTGVQV